MADPFKIGPISRNFMHKAGEVANKTGVAKWIPKFWDAVGKGQTTEASNYFKTIVHIVTNNADKTITAELEAVVPELEVALAEIGVDLTAESIAAELAAGVTTVAGGAAAINPVTVAIIVVAVLAFAAIAAHSEVPPPPRQVPPQYRGNTELDPAAKLQLELMVQRMGRNVRPGKAGH